MSKHEQRKATPKPTTADVVQQLVALNQKLDAVLLHLGRHGGNGTNGGAPGGLVGERFLKVDEAAERLGYSKWYLYRQAKHLPFAVKLTPKMLRFSEVGLEQWIRSRDGASTPTGESR